MFRTLKSGEENMSTTFLHEVLYGQDGADVGVVMGSNSDWPTMKLACKILDLLGVPWERRITSAHRTPVRMFQYAETAEARGLKVIIAGAGGAAHLPGMLSGSTILPVHGVPIKSSALSGVDWSGRFCRCHKVFQQRRFRLVMRALSTLRFKQSVYSH